MKEILSNKIILFVFAIIAINSLLFLLVPDRSIFMFNMDKFMTEPWRFLTFQFFHVSSMHLIENIAALIFVGFIAIELGLSFRKFLLVYFVSIFIVIFPLAILFSQNTIAGNSMGIFGVMGLLLIKGRRLIPQKLSFPIFLFIIFSLTLFSFVSCGPCYEDVFKSDVFHFFGFACGVLMTRMPAPKIKHTLSFAE